MFDKAIEFAEKIAKGECGEDDLKEIELNSENGALMVTAKANARHAVEAFNNKYSHKDK